MEPEAVAGGDSTGEEIRCPACADARFVRRGAPIGHPAFGTVEPCPACALLALDRLEAVQARAGVPGEFRSATLENWEDQPDAAALRIARAYVDFWGAAPPFLMLIGPTTGNGKTRLACSIVNALWLQQRVRPRFWVVADLLDVWRDLYSQPRAEDGRSAEHAFRESLRHCPLLVLDDFGAQRDTDWAIEQLFKLINHRYQERRATLLTSNLSSGEFAERMPREISRLRDPNVSTVVLLTGPDRRLAQSAEPPWWTQG